MAEQDKQKTRHGISELFINRPITTTLVMVAFVLFGFIGYRALPVSDLPTVDYPTISVNASLPGANPETMAASVATPLERQLSAGMPSPPSLRKVNPADSPILFLSLNSQVLPLATVDEYAETLVAQRISMVEGVSQVQVYGAQKYAVRIQVDPAKLADRGIGIDQVNSAITNGNPNTAVGTLYGTTTNLTLQ